jgi:hypothetical protein
LKFWPTFCSVVEFAMCWSRIPDRRNQVWQKPMFKHNRTGGYDPVPETVVVVDLPKPVQEDIFDRLLGDRAVYFRSGWSHKVVDLETGKTYELNEAWFVEEKNDSYVRVT